MREEESSNGLISSSTRARPTLLVHVISTDRLFHTRDSRIEEIDVQFFGKSTTNEDMCFQTKLAVPSGWPPRMLLAIIDQSVQIHRVISLDYVKIAGVNCPILNETFFQFSLSLKDLKERFPTFNVKGGEL